MHRIFVSFTDEYLCWFTDRMAQALDLSQVCLLNQAGRLQKQLYVAIELVLVDHTIKLLRDISVSINYNRHGQCIRIVKKSFCLFCSRQQRVVDLVRAEKTFQVLDIGWRQ